MPHPLYSPETRHRAFEMYIDGHGTLAEIAGELDLPVETVKTWHRRDAWRTKRSEIEREIHSNWRENYVRSLQDIRAATILNHFKIVEEIQNRMIEMLEGDLNPRQLANVSRALKTSWSAVERYIAPKGRNARVVSERPGTSDPLVIVGIEPADVPHRRRELGAVGERPF